MFYGRLLKELSLSLKIYVLTEEKEGRILRSGSDASDGLSIIRMDGL